MKILTDILIISLFCNGWNLITSDGMVLFFIRKGYLSLASAIQRSDGEIVWDCYYNPLWSRFYRSILKFFYKPLFGCLPCMSSIWGTLVYFGLGNDLNLIYPIVIISAAGVNLLIHKIYEY